MRLSDGERTGILRAVSGVLPDAQVYLYGSRTDDTLRGGDIDLLILLSDQQSETIGSAIVLDDFVQIKIKLSIALERELGERRIDITLGTHKDLTENDFLRMIWPTVIPITAPT